MTIMVVMSFTHLKYKLKCKQQHACSYENLNIERTSCYVSHFLFPTYKKSVWSLSWITYHLNNETYVFCFRIRGALSSLLTLKLNIGILFGYITGTYLQWFSRCIILMVFPILFFIIFNFIPESPQHFLKIGQFQVGFYLFIFCFKILFS